MEFRSHVDRLGLPCVLFATSKVQIDKEIQALAEEPGCLIVKATTVMHSFPPLMENFTRALFDRLSLYADLIFLSKKQRGRKLYSCVSQL